LRSEHAKAEDQCGAAKRFKKTGTGKIKRSKAYRRHQLSCKTSKQKRHLRKGVVVDPANAKKIAKRLPYL
jgi:large subunit ribosomal protein L35